MKFTDNVTWTQFTFVIGIMMTLFGILFNMISNTNKELSVYNDKFYGQITEVNKNISSLSREVSEMKGTVNGISELLKGAEIRQ